MEIRFGFTKMDIREFENWIKNTRVARTVMKIQQHHTWNPSYSLFTGLNHFERQKAMRDHHVVNNGWNDIGQHFTVFPDGIILTGRSLELSPACITNQNANSICLEHLGNFDVDGDNMTDVQKDTIVTITALLCKKFNLEVDTTCIVYHHWYELGTGIRNNGSGGNKSCPGTNFFGGNKPQDCEQHFLPLVRTKMDKPDANQAGSNNFIGYAMVTANRLNIRSGPGITNPVVQGREAVVFGAIVRVYKEVNSWQKISSSAEHWVSSRFTKILEQQKVKANVLNVRSGPGTQFDVLDTLEKGAEVFVYEQSAGWTKISMDEKWVSSSFLQA